VPRVPKPWSPPHPFGKLGAELLAPLPDASVVRDYHATLSRDQLDLTQAQAENILQPHGVAGDLGREAIAVIQTHLWRHLVSFAGSSS
jgi:hypothetical protein